MNCIIIAVVSEDGFLTKDVDQNPSSWSSTEDQKFYSETLNKYDLYLLGRTTYELAKNNLPETAHKIVLTNEFSDKIRTDLTFTKDPLEDIIDNYSEQYDDLLVLGGASIYRQMLDKNLINEIYLTVEPVMNKSGVKFIENGNYLNNLGFKLAEATKLNTKGTVLKHYVLKK